MIRRVPRGFPGTDLMSGPHSPGPAPDMLELAALLCSRVCHDLISPVGAIVNGLEVLDDNPRITWNLPRVLLPKNKVKLLLNMLVIAQQTIPRGGMLTVDPVGDGEAGGFRVAASGLNARMPQAIADLLSGQRAGSIDAHAVQPYYT